MSLDKATVARIAHLARIRLPAEDQEGMTQELSQILGFVEQLDEVDTTGVAPMTSAIAHSLHRRPDRVIDGGVQEKVLANAPETMSGFYVVPKVVE